MGTQLVPPKGALQPSLFSPCTVVKRLDDQDATWYRRGPWPRPHWVRCVTDQHRPTDQQTTLLSVAIGHILYAVGLLRCSGIITRIWANAQRDGRPAEYRWRPLINAAKFGWRPLLECRAVTLPSRETSWNLHGCPKLAKRSQPCSPYYDNMWRRYQCLTSFFPIVDTCLSCEDMARQSCAMVPKWRFFASCIFSEPRAAAHFILNSH